MSLDFDAAADAVAADGNSGKSSGLDFDTAADRVVSDSDTRRQQNIFASLDTDAGRYALAKKIGDHLGIPVPVAERNLPEVQRQYKIAQMDHLLRGNEKLAREMERPDFAKLIGDRAAEVSDILNGVGRMTEIKPSRLEQFGNAVRGGFAQARQNITIAAKQMGLYDGADAEFGTRVADQERRIESFRATDDIQAGLEKISKATTMDEALQAIVENPAAVLDTSLRSLGSSSPSLAAAAGLSVFGPVGTAIGAGSGSFGVEYAATIGDVLKEHGVSFNDPYALSKAFNDKDLMSAAREKAIKRGMAVGAFDAITAGIAGKLLAGAKPTAMSIASRVAGEMAVQAGGGMAGEASAQALTDEYKPGEILLEGFAELPTGIVEVRSNWRHARDQAVRKLQDDALKALDAKTTADSMNDIITRVAGEPMLKDAPDVLAQSLNNAAMQGQDVSEVYINARQLATVFNQSAVAVAETLGIDVEAFDSALQHNADVAIPVGEFITAVAANDQMRPLVDHVKIGIDEMSMAEARQWESANGEAFRKEAERLIVMREDEQAFAQSAKEVEDFVFNQMKTAGRHSDSVNRADAMLHKAFASVMAERTGMLPMEFFQKHLLKVQAEGVAGLQFDQAGKLKTETPEFKHWFGEDSNLRKDDGSPMVLYHGTESPSITTFRKSKTGAMGEAVYLGDSQEVAESYGNFIMPVYARGKYIGNTEWSRRIHEAGGWDQARKIAESEGISGVWDQKFESAVSVWDPKNIKSATGNNGQFNPNDQNILHQSETTARQVARDFMAMVKELGKDAFQYPNLILDKDLGKVLASTGEARFDIRKVSKEESQRSAATETYEIDAGEGMKGYVYRFGNEVQIDVSKFESGAGRGSAVYQSVANWAKANGWIFEGDSAGITLPGLLRRTENMISTIARNQDSDHVRPHPDQLRPENNPQAKEFGLTQIKWATGETEQNLGELLIASYSAIKTIYPEIENVQATEFGDFTDTSSLDFTNREGELLGDAEFEKIADEIAARFERFRKEGQEGSISPYGVSTIKRASVVGSLVRRASDGTGAGIRPAAVTLEGRLYQSADQKELIVQHNLTAANLLHAVKMGGIPVPSLAVTKKDHPLQNFGEITLLGSKDMADPKGYAGTKVFGADIYSPRYPTITYKLDSKALKKLNAALASFRKDGGREIYGGEISKIEDLTQTDAFRAYMLDKTGKTDIWDLRSGDMEAEASRMLSEAGAEEKLFKGFDYNGNRRYQPHTLENVVKILKKELRGGENFNYGVGSIRAKFTPQFRTIEQIRKAKDRLMDKAAFKRVKDEIDAEFNSLMDALAQYHSHGEKFGFGDVMTQMMYDAAAMGVSRSLRENQFQEVPADTQQDIAEFLTRLRNLPAEYFEAKILRDVDLAEFSGAVVPEGVDQKVVDALQARGVKDIKFYKKGDDADRTAKIGEFENLFFQKQGTGNRGSFSPDTNTITLLQNADLSTFLHESGHYFLEVIASVASQPDAPAQVKNDMDVLLGWFGVKATPELSAAEVWSLMSLEEKRQYHEQFARGFESYLFEGKAPNLELQGIFSRFRRWLIDIYKSVSNLDVQLTDEVRAVMDRMVATDEQIADAEAARRFAPIFQTQEESGMDDAQWAAYQAEPVDATDTAAADLQARSIRDMRWLTNAKSKKMAELQKASKAIRDVVEMGARSEVMSQPIYMAWQFLTGKPEKAKAKPKKSADLDPTNDSLFVAIAKLGGIDKLEIVQTWGTDQADIKALPRPVFGKPIVRANDGKSIYELAQRLGEYGYIPLDENDNADVRDLEDAFAAELRGDEQFSSQKDYAATMPEPGWFDLENYPHGKLDADAVRAFYGSDSSIPQIMEGLNMLGKEGYQPDEVAAEFGFSSGDDLMRQLAVAQPPKELIAQMVDQRMLEEHGSLSSEQAIEAAAESAIHNDVRARFLTRELNALRKATGKASILLKAARDFAEQKIASLKVRDAVKSSQHTAAEARSAKAADEAFKAGKTEEAATHKRDQVLNHELARASLSAKAEIAQIQRFLKRYDSQTTRKAISHEYRDQIDAILEKFDLRQSVSDKELERRRSLSDWIASQEAMGIDPAIDERLVRDTRKKHIRDLTLDELRGLKDSVANIEHLGRLKNRLLTAAKNRNLQAVSAEIAASLNKFGKGRGMKDADIGDAHGLAALKQFGEGFAAEHRKLASIARQMDGDQDGGPMWEYFIRSMNAAGDKEATMRAKMSEKLANLFDQIKGINLSRKEQVMPGVSLTRENMLMMALNWGNAGNRQRLMDGGLNNAVKNLTAAQVESIIGRLSKQEMDFVQGVWDLIEANRPAIAEQELRLTGVEPKWVESVPVVTAHGTYRGGYFPAKYDGNFSSRSNELEAITDLRQQMQGAAGRAQTRKGYTQDRAAEVSGRPLKLGFSVLTQHINEVTHRLAWQDWLIDTNRLLKRDEIEQAIRDHYGPVMLKQIKDAVKDIAAGDIGASSMMERGLNHIRTGATIAGLGWNLTTAFLQPLGLTQSIVRIGWAPVARGAKAFIAHPWKTIDQVESRSEFMKHRAATMNREINDVLNRVRNDKMSRIEGSFFYMIQALQKVADMPTWLGEYEKQIAAGNDEARSIALADQAVMDAQGAGQMKDLSAIQRGVGPWGAAKKLFTNFYSYFNVTYNLAVERGRATEFKDPMAVGKLAVDYLMLFTVPAVLGTLLKELVRGSDDDWDKEKLLKKLAKEQLNYLMGTMVLTREVGAAITGDYGYSGPAGVRLFAEINKLAKQVEQGEVDTALVKAAINVAGIAGLPVIGQFPSGQINRTIDGVVAVSEGTAGPQAVIFGAPLKH